MAFDFNSTAPDLSTLFGGTLNDAAKHRTLTDVRHPDWTAWRFHHVCDDFYAELISRIRGARSVVRIETYIFQMDSLTNVILQELHQARRRGCDVQLLVDGFGSYYWLDSITARCRRDGIDLHVWRPLPRGLGGFRRLPFPLTIRFTRWLRRLNRRDHRKIALIDDTVALVGSMNLTQVHSERIMGPKAWRDSGVVVEGESVRDLVDAFHVSWRKANRTGLRRLALPSVGARSERRYDPRDSRVRLNSDRKSRRFLARDLLRRIHRSQARILIVSAYFMPTRPLLVALRKAARRGVRVEIVTPGPSDVPLVKWASAGASKILLRAGVRLHEYQSRILHAKYFIIDDWASLGSTNLNHRSLFHDLEAEATFDAAAAVDALAAQWEVDRASSRALTLREFTSRTLVRRALESLAYRFRYLL